METYTLNTTLTVGTRYELVVTVVYSVEEEDSGDLTLTVESVDHGNEDVHGELTDVQMFLLRKECWDDFEADCAKVNGERDDVNARMREWDDRGI